MKINIRDLLFFDKFILPTILSVLYWVLEVLVIIGAIVSMFFGPSFWGGLMMLVFGVIGVRLWFELVMLAFRIYETLQKIALNTATTTTTTNTTQVLDKE